MNRHDAVIQDYLTIMRSGLFDRGYYVSIYPDVEKAGIDPLKHYLLYGAAEDRSPSPHFNVHAYLDAKPEVKASGVNPLLHFIRTQYNVVIESGLFDEIYYYTTYPDVWDAGVNPIVHYLMKGAEEKRNPSSSFNTYQYLVAHPEVAASGENPLLHHIQTPYQAINLRPSSAYRIPDPEHIRNKIDAYRQNKRPDNRIAVYTAIVDGYDTLKIPESPSMHIDYYCFTNTPTPDYGIYTILPIDYFDADPTRTARYLKTHPHFYFGGYDVVVWIDANIVAKTNLIWLVQEMETSNTPLRFIKHFLRNTVEAEARECIVLERDDAAVIEDQMASYRRDRFATSALIETGLILSRVQHAQVEAFFNRWWREIDTFSRRDQLSINYALDQVGTEWSWLFEPGLNVRNHPGFRLLNHSADSPPDAYDVSSVIDEQKTIFPYVKSKSYRDVMPVRIDQRRELAVDIVICVHNAAGYVRRCLTSVLRTRAAHHRIILIDDGSDDETRIILEKTAAANSRVILSRRNMAQGYTRAVNQGLNLSTADFVILLNSDTVVSENWIEKLVDAVYSVPGAGIVGPLSNAASHQSIPNHESSPRQTAINALPLGVTIDEMNRHCETWAHADLLPRVPLIHGFCMGIRREVIDAIGIMDETNFPEGFGEEDDYCFRAVNAGFSLVVATHTFVYHAKTQSYTQERRFALTRQGGLRLKQLHGAARVGRAVASMQKNPLLAEIREKTGQLTRAYTELPNQTRQKKLRVGIYQQPNLTSSTFIRLLLPLATSIAASVIEPTVLSPDEIAEAHKFDICIVQRAVLPDLEHAQKLLRILSESNTPLIVDNDDAFVLMHNTHPSYDFYMSRSDALNLLLKEADEVWLSTEELARVYRPIRADVRVIPNSIDVGLWHQNGQRHGTFDAEHLRLVYMGSRTHHEDLMMILPALDRLAKGYPGAFTLTLIGVTAAPLKRDWIQHITVPATRYPYPEFVPWLISQGPFDVGLSPLMNGGFNRCKSDIKLLDYCALGIFPVVSDIEAYRIDPNLARYCRRVTNTTGNWYAALADIIEQPHKYAVTIADAQAYVRQERSTELIGDRQVHALWSLLQQTNVREIG